jgi:hypothetical protein
MRIFMVGGIRANLKSYWTDAWISQKSTGDKGMRVQLAGTMNGNMSSFLEVNKTNLKPDGVDILESFYYVDEHTERLMKYFGTFMLDSGAFTMFTSGHKAKGIVWEEYVDRYADFIVRNNVELFFELDIDKLIGYDRVLELRNRLEKKAERQCIPVWHKFRGKEKFLQMCDEYGYVAIGGIVSGEITRDEYKYFPWFIKTAHDKGAKIHGLGFTNLALLPHYHFDSVDSTAWTTGNRFGAVYWFDGKTIRKRGKGEGQKMKDSRAVAINNFTEWVKFQQYARRYL